MFQQVCKPNFRQWTQKKFRMELAFLTELVREELHLTLPLLISKENTLHTSMRRGSDVKCVVIKNRLKPLTKERIQRQKPIARSVTAQCKNEWDEIVELEKKSTLSDEEKKQLDHLKNTFNLVLCADYQMCKLVPYWGMSPQPGSTYYLQKLNHDILLLLTMLPSLHLCICLMKEWVQRTRIIPSPISLTIFQGFLTGYTGFICFLITLPALTKTFI